MSHPCSIGPALLKGNLQIAPVYNGLKQLTRRLQEGLKPVGYHCLHEDKVNSQAASVCICTLQGHIHRTFQSVKQHMSRPAVAGWMATLVVLHFSFTNSQLYHHSFCMVCMQACLVLYICDCAVLQDKQPSEAPHAAGPSPSPSPLSHRPANGCAYRPQICSSTR